MKTVILAGGSGERFWPLSTPGQPKQFLRLFNDRSLLRNTYDRLRYRQDEDEIVIVTSKQHVDMTKKEIPDLPGSNIIGEPRRMNTAPACVIGSMMAQEDEPVLVVPADHMIPDQRHFWEMVEKGLAGVREIGGLFTFGIEPQRPDTGYGYIEKGSSLTDGVLEVRSFREKPDMETAREFIGSNEFLWNSGMFLWKPADLFNEMKRHCPSVIEPFGEIDPTDPNQLKEAYSLTERISIDYAVMERSDRVRVVPTDLEWSDLGSWESIMELEGPSEQGPDLALMESENVLVRSPEGKKVAVVGLRDIVVVDSDEGLLVVSRDRSQRVRDASRHLN